MLDVGGSAMRLVMSGEVEDALRSRKPVVAIESALLLHSLPYPRNVACVRRCVRACRQRGVVAAVVAMVEGRLMVGIDEQCLEGLAGRCKAAIQAFNAAADAFSITDVEVPNATPEVDVRKAGVPTPSATASTESVCPICVADIGTAMLAGWSGGLTTAATIAVARLSGISVCVASVVRGARLIGRDSPASSPDLYAMRQRPPVAVVTAGIMSLTDIAYSRHYLSALSISMVGVDCSCLPRFLDSADDPARRGELRISRVDAPQDHAALLRAIVALDQPSALLVADPHPAPSELSQQDCIPLYIPLRAPREEIDPIPGEPIHAPTRAIVGAALEAIEGNCRLAAEISVAFSADAADAGAGAGAA